MNLKRMGIAGIVQQECGRQHAVLRDTAYAQGIKRAQHSAQREHSIDQKDKDSIA